MCYKYEGKQAKTNDDVSHQTLIISQINSQLIDYVHFFYYINLRVGVCLPSKCSLQEVDHIVNDGEHIQTSIIFTCCY